MYDRLTRYESLDNRVLFGPITLAYRVMGDSANADRICLVKDLVGSSSILEAQCKMLR